MLQKSLIITEKPSVAYEFAKILGVSGRKDGYLENGSYVITWCVGHLVEMAYPGEYDEKYKKWRLEDLPFLPREYKYHVIPNVKKQYDVVHSLLHRDDIMRVYWAGDAGKEGQTIEENIRRFGGVREGMEELRIWIDSQTEEEIMRGIREAKPMADYDNLANSGIMRTMEDYAMGINFSRVMSIKYGKLLNDAAATKNYTAIAVGRVMTCVLGMAVIREREIRDFSETPFYRVTGRFGARDNEDFLEAEWRAAEGSRYFESPLLYKENGFQKRESAEALIEELAGKTAIVDSIARGSSRKRAPLLFNLAELQAECAKRFKISPDETLQAAQALYEKKLATYPRTDARVLSSAVAKEIGRNLNRLKGYEPTRVFAERILSGNAHQRIGQSQYTDDSKITDHYAIIPTGQLTELASLTELQRRVFDLIVRRFLSIFYPPAEYQTAKLAVKIEREQFSASAKELKNPGYLEIAGLPKKEEASGEERESPGFMRLAKRLKKGEELLVHGFEIKQGKTTPPKRYTSGSMVLAMENAGQLIEEEELREQIKGSGIGTSATRAEIIKKLVRVGYLNLNKKTQVLSPEPLGEMIFEVVSLTVPALLNPKMTASWEKGLDGITRGSVRMEEYRGKLEDFIRRETVSMMENNLTEEIAARIRPFAEKGGRGQSAFAFPEKPKPVETAVKCPHCGKFLLKSQWNYECRCGFQVSRIVAKAPLPEDIIRELLDTGKTKEKVTGFVSKAGNLFDAYLRYEDGKILFDFNRPAHGGGRTTGI